MSATKKLFFTVNIIFAFLALSFFSDMPVLSSVYVRGAMSGAAILFLPGAAYSALLLRRIRDALLKFYFSIPLSSFLVIIGLFFFRLSAIDLTPAAFLFYLWPVSNLGFIWLALAGQMPEESEVRVNAAGDHSGDAVENYIGGEALSRREGASAGYYTVIFAAALIFLGFNARFMPLILDMDVHFSSPSYGIAHELKPYTDISRVPYLVDHPQWPLLLSAGTVLLMGDLESTRHHYDEAKRIEEVFPEKYLKYAWGLTGMVRDMLEEKRLSADRRLLFDLRIPHVFLGAVFLLFIFEIIRRETGSAAAGVLGSFLVMNPEMVARFTSAGWTPAIILTMTVMCYLYLYYPRKHVMAAAAAFLGAWAYQKTVILPLSVLFAELYRKRGRISMTALSSPLGWAVGIGTVSLYGAFLNWGCFYEAFFVTHGVSGMLYSFKNVTGFAAAWARASLNMSWMIFFPAIAGLVYMFKKRRGKRDLVIPFWFLIGTFIFMFTIWPITRNSCLVYPPMIIALALSVSRISKKVLRRFFYFSLAAVHLIHLFIMYPTLRDPNEYYTLNEKGKGPRQALREHYVNMRKDFLRLISGFYYFSGDRDSAAGLYRSAMSPEISSLRSFYDEGISAQDLETIISSDALLEEELNLAPSSEDMVHDIGLLYLPLKNVSYYYSVSAAYEALKQKEKAAEAAEKTIENAKEYLLEEGIYPDIYRSMALAYIYLGKTEQAKDILEKSVELRPTGYKSFTMLAVILSHLGDNEGAMESARKALELAPREPEVCITLGRLYYASGEYDKAVEFFKRCVSHTPETFLKARYELARSYFKSGQDTEAERYYREVIEEQPLHGGAWYGLSVIYYKRGEISKARDYYEKASRYGFMDDVLGYLIQGAGDGDSGRIDGNSITDPDAFRSQGAGQTEDQPGKEIQE